MIVWTSAVCITRSFTLALILGPALWMMLHFTSLRDNVTSWLPSDLIRVKLVSWVEAVMLYPVSDTRAPLSSCEMRLRAGLYCAVCVYGQSWTESMRGKPI